MKKFNWKNFLIVLLLASFVVGATYKDGIEYVRVIISSPIDSESGAVEVSIQDQHSKALDLYFINSTQIPTMLSLDADPEDRTVVLVDATGFVDGTYVGIFSGAGEFYFGTQLGAPVGNEITLDTPIDLQFLAGSNVIAATNNLAVDGSVTPITFQIGSAGTDREIDITRIAGYMQSSTAMDDSRFGGGTALTNGIVFRRTDGVITNSWNVKTNAQMALLCASDFYYTEKAPAGFFGARLRNSYAGPEKHGVTIRLCAGDTLEIIIQDDLTSRLVIFYLMAQGHEVIL
ncbi:hypothetical protein KAR91_53350 [Candidatus Pacearchaeota archaeon]|nr:hypothetical protein [Candidatus Pacearchaeota archaeon]